MSAGTVLHSDRARSDDRSEPADGDFGSDPVPHDSTLARVRRFGLVVLAAQFVGLVLWSAVLANRYALSYDFAAYHQAWWLIGHGNLDPFDTITGFPLWADQAELLLWPLSFLGVLWPHAVTQLWVQDAAVVGAEAVAFLWICDMAAGPRTVRIRQPLPTVIAACGLVLLVVDPWLYWAASFDFHMEPFGALFLLLAARTLYRDPADKKVWIWVALALACGDVVATFVVALGLSAVLAGRRWWRPGLLIAAAGVIWSLVIVVLGANKSSGLAAYSYLVAVHPGNNHAVPGLPQIATAVIGHPGRVTAILWDRRLGLYASLATGGLVGVLSPWALVMTVVVLLENGLNHSLGFLTPGFQELLLLVLIPVGTVDVLVRLGRRRPRWAAVAAVLLAANALLWSALWLPRTANQWLRVSPAAASALKSVQHRIGATDEVMASQGIAGRFSNRKWIYSILIPGAIPVHTATVWVIVAPEQGVETVPVPVSDAVIAELAGPLHATLVSDAAGVWAFRWSPPPGTRSLTVPSAVPTVEAWTTTGAAGKSTTAGPSADWRAVGTGQPGYVVAGDYWREPPGHYQVTVELSTTVPVHVEVWNATGNVLLARRDVPPTNGFAAESLTVD
ncbi:MAG: DUF2079 domain-containing protein, partial [Acidimicrobiales bacterium]